MMRLRSLKVVATPPPPADVMIFGEVGDSEITLRVAVRVAEVQKKLCRSLVMWPSADFCLWTAEIAFLYEEGKCQLDVILT